MSTGNNTGSSLQNPAALGGSAETKGKGKSLATDNVEDTSMAVDEEDDDDDKDEESDEEAEAADDDGMDEIDPNNVIGRRTRGKIIDFAAAAAQNPPRATKMRTTTRTLRSRTRRWTTPRWCPPQKLRASRNQSRGYPVKTRDELGFIPSSRRHEWRDGCENPGCSFHLYTDQMS
ncbi:hypothetical protein B0T18DRAFT_491167 [Schizothecium vesticola]|uniref:Histone chaperone domain-containing protein n=1 Tax=Schizothecium vesticola TaxID=314040 RepID=A0AA40EJL5_9PEZI|nr:hypothetical protein B0T18DRAFT_491167 [Schizothecium vesticola]